MAANQTEKQARIARWYGEWQVPMRRWLQSRSSVPYDALDDVVQEAFIRLLRYTDDELVENPQSYMFRIATNVAHEWRERAANRHPHHEEWLEDIEDEKPLTENALYSEQQCNAIREAVKCLPPRAAAMVIYHMHGLTYGDIAKRMGITYRIVLRDLTRAYAQLRKDLDPWR